MFYMIKFQHDWADEHNVYGIKMCDALGLEEVMTAAEEAEYPCEKGFGTNQWFEWSSLDEWKRGIKVIELSWHDYSVICNAFGFEPLHGGEWGSITIPGEW